MAYVIKNYTKEKAKALGYTVKPSTNTKKKIDVFKGDKKVASIGAKGYLDYPSYIVTEGKAVADERRRLYHIRHKNDKNITGILARKLLW
jgi:hypothetical protein